MLRKKYRLSCNNGLLPKITPKSSQQMMTTYALLNQSRKKQYELLMHPVRNETFVMFNQIQYLQRKCSKVIVDHNCADTIETVGQIYPHSGQTLGIFVANDPEQTDRLLLGLEHQKSMLGLVYNQLRVQKKGSNEIFMSIIGIENENSLTDELYFQWIKKGEKLLQGKEPIKNIIEAKSKISIAKEGGSYVAEDVSRHKVDSEEILNQILKRYSEVKNYLEGWIEVKEKRQYYLMGQIYHLCEAEFDSSTGRVTNIIKSHYILRINQYVRTTSPLLLKLGMNLKRLYDNNSSWLQNHDNKVFKLLSECFNTKVTKKMKFHFHLFLQVGEYQRFKDEYICLVPTSQFLNGTGNRQNSGQSEFIYCKYYIENERILEIINQIEEKLSERQKEKMRIYIRQSQRNGTAVKFSLKNKSYYYDTVSSVQKKTGKHHMATEGGQIQNQCQLQHLVEETSKIYKLPPIKKMKTESSHVSETNSRRNNISKFKIVLKNRNENDRPAIHTKKSTLANEKSDVNEGDMNGGKKYSESKFYNEIKGWLNHVYGKNSNSKIKQFYNAIHKKASIVASRRQNKNQTPVRKNNYNTSSKALRKYIDRKLNKAELVSQIESVPKTDKLQENILIS